MYKTSKLVVTSALCALLSGQALAGGITFAFSEVGNNVVMNSSGTINTSKLVVQNSASQWGSTGLQSLYSYSIMGGTDVGQVDMSFGFHGGTDFTPWSSVGGLWTAGWLGATSIDSGNKGFATYIWDDAGSLYPGLGIEQVDLENVWFWSPDQNWTFTNTNFAQLGWIAGTYTVVDAVTEEFISFKIGEGNNQIPEPTTLLLLGMGLAGLSLVRRKN